MRDRGCRVGGHPSGNQYFPEDADSDHADHRFFIGMHDYSFVFVKETVPSHLSGTVSGVINMGVMTGPMVLQPAVGWMLDYRWAGDMAAGVRVYSAEAYRNGFSLMLAWIAVSFILLLFTRETGCRQVVE